MCHYFQTVVPPRAIAALRSTQNGRGPEQAVVTASVVVVFVSMSAIPCNVKIPVLEANGHPAIPLCDSAAGEQCGKSIFTQAVRRTE